MRPAVRQTKIPFSERKLLPRVRNKCATPKKVSSSEDEYPENESPLKYKLVVRSENKIVLRISQSRSERTALRSPDRLSKQTGRLSRTPKRGADKEESLNSCPTPAKQKHIDLPNEKTPIKDFATPSSLLKKLELSSSKTRAKDERSPKSEKNFKPKELFPSKSASTARKALYSNSNSLPCREKEIDQLNSLLEKHLNEQSCGSIYIAGLPGTGKTASVEHVLQADKIRKGFHIVKINCTSVSSSITIYRRICCELKIKTTGKVEKDPKVIIEKFLLRRHKMILLILDEIDQLETRSHSVLYNIFEWPSWEKAKLVLIGIANAMDLTDRILPRLCAKVELKPILLHFLPYTKDQIKAILSQRLSEVGVDGLFTPSAIELISAKVAGMSGDVRRALDLGRRVVEVSEETKSVLEKTSKKIEHGGINEDFLTDCWKGNGLRRSPRKLSTKEKYSEILTVTENTPPMSSKAFFSSNGMETSKMNKRVLEDDQNEEGVLREINFNLSKTYENKSSELNQKSPSKTIGISSPEKAGAALKGSPPRISPFNVDSKDVLNVVKNLYGSSKTLRSINEDSSFPLHQKILICTFMLIAKKGKTKDLNVGKLHQVYTKICTKRGITPVDLSGFLFLCRQVEMTGIMEIGKGPGKLAKVTLLWDEAEVTDALKDLNLLSSIMDDVSCL